MVMGPALMLCAAGSPAATPGLCALAVVDLERSAVAQGLVARATCRMVDGVADGVAEPAPFEASPVAAVERPPLRSGRMTWPVRVRQAGAAARVHQVPLSVDLRALAWVAVRDVASGEDLRESDLVNRETAWTAGAVTTAVPVGRLSRSLRAGDVVSHNDLIPPDTARRGDAVQIVLRQGPLELRVPGQLLAQARVGQSVRAQPLGRPAAISGVLTTLSTVESNLP